MKNRVSSKFLVARNSRFDGVPGCDPDSVLTRTTALVVMIFVPFTPQRDVNRHGQHPTPVPLDDGKSHVTTSCLPDTPLR